VSEPTAREALLSLAAHFDSLADGMRTESFIFCYRDAANLARIWARGNAHGQPEAEPVQLDPGEAKRLSDDLRDAKPLPPGVLDAVDAALDDLPQPESRFERDRWRIASRIALFAAEPIIRADERKRYRRANVTVDHEDSP
jgi:hypothetical protein